MPRAAQIFSNVAIEGSLQRINRLDRVDCGIPEAFDRVYMLQFRSFSNSRIRSRQVTLSPPTSIILFICLFKSFNMGLTMIRICDIMRIAIVWQQWLQL